MSTDSAQREVTQRRQKYELPDGRTVFASPLVLRDLATVEQEVLSRYKKAYMKSVMDSVEFLPEDMREKKIAESWEKMLAFTSADLPKKTVTSYVPLPSGKFQRDAAGKLVQAAQEVPYDVWWINSTWEGKAFSTWISLRKEQPDITLEYVEGLVVQNQAALDELADIVGELTKPSLGNDSSSVPEQKATAV